MTGSALFITCLSQGVHKGWRMVNERLCETARLAFFFASQRHFDFLDCETETSKCFDCERETCSLLKLDWELWKRARMSLYMQKSLKRAFCCKPLCETLHLKIYQQLINFIISLWFVWKWAKRARPCLISVEVKTFIEMGKKSSSSHRRRKDESRKYSMKVCIYQCAYNSLTSISALRKQPRNAWPVRCRGSSFIQLCFYYYKYYKSMEGSGGKLYWWWFYFFQAGKSWQNRSKYLNYNTLGCFLSRWKRGNQNQSKWKLIFQRLTPLENKVNSNKGFD